MIFDPPPPRPKITEADILAALSRNLVYDPVHRRWRRQHPVLETVKRAIRRLHVTGLRVIRPPVQDDEVAVLFDDVPDHQSN